MTKQFEAVYEAGMLRPLEAPTLDEYQRVTVILASAPARPDEETWLDAECVQLCPHDVDASISLESVRRALSKIPGSLTADFAAERAQQ